MQTNDHIDGLTTLLDALREERRGLVSKANGKLDTYIASAAAENFVELNNQIEAVKLAITDEKKLLPPPQPQYQSMIG